MTDSLISAVLILVVLRQISEHKLEPHVLVLPTLMVAGAGWHYLDGFTVGGNDGILIGLLVALGAGLGIAGGMVTHMRADDGAVFVRAGWAAASLWVGGMAARAVFVFAVGHGFTDDVARFSVAHQITGEQAWAVALIGMAVAEVALRMIVVFARGRRLAAGPALPALVAA